MRVTLLAFLITGLPILGETGALVRTASHSDVPVCWGATKEFLTGIVYRIMNVSTALLKGAVIIM